MKKAVTLFKTIIMSLGALVAGYAAISLPFKLFTRLSADGMRYLFIGELVLYFLISIAFIVAKEKSRQRKIKEAQKRVQRREKFQKAQEEYYSLAA